MPSDAPHSPSGQVTKLDTASAWSVRVTFPPGSTDSKGEARHWAHNDTITVITHAGVTGAIAAVAEAYPSATVWAVNHVGSRTMLIVHDAPETAS
jgi:hypothetical protein